jgi:hypothetical protein
LLGRLQRGYRAMTAPEHTSPQANPLQPPELPPLKKTRVDRVAGWSILAESLLAVSISLACFCLVLLALLAVFDERPRHDLAAFAKCAHENWRVALVFLFPWVRLSWLRIEPRIREVGATTKLDPVQGTVGTNHTPWLAPTEAKVE